MKAKEAKARIKINNLLAAAGWRFFDDENGPANIELEPAVKLTINTFNNLGENFDKVKNGFVDFLPVCCHKSSSLQINPAKQ